MCEIPDDTKNYEILHPKSPKEFERKERNPLNINLIPILTNLPRTRKALHIPNPLEPCQVRADIGVAVVQRDELFVGGAAAPKNCISTPTHNGNDNQKQKNMQEEYNFSSWTRK
jgi:hypothetical protein